MRLTMQLPRFARTLRPHCQQAAKPYLAQRALPALEGGRRHSRCGAGDSDAQSAEPEKFINLKDFLDEVGRTDHVFEDKDDGDVWAHEGRLAAAPPAPEELQSMPEVKGALSPDAADILTAYSTEQGFKEVTVDTLYAQLRPAAAPGGGGASTSAPKAAAGAPAIIDVRTRGEFAGGRVPGALNVPLDELSDAVRAGRLDDFRARPLAVVCQIGMRSAQATVRLSRVFKFENPYNVAGGTSAWVAAGYPLEFDDQ